MQLIPDDAEIEEKIAMITDLLSSSVATMLHMAEKAPALILGNEDTAEEPSRKKRKSKKRKARLKA